MPIAPHTGLDDLLALDGTSVAVAANYAVKIRATRIAPDAGRPHGIDYSLVLIGPGGERLVGYDNAHVLAAGSGPAAKSRKKIPTYDHRHMRGVSRPYGFISPGQLLLDFWADVETVLKEDGIA